MASPAQLRMIGSMWAKVSYTKGAENRQVALDTFCKKQYGKTLMELDSFGAKVMIETITGMGGFDEQLFAEAQGFVFDEEEGGVETPLPKKVLRDGATESERAG